MFLKISAAAFAAVLVVCHAGHIGHSLHHSQGHGVSSQSVSIDHGIQSHGYHDHHDHGEHAHPRYEYKYTVNDEVTRDQKSHTESRDGDSVRGEYSLVQPDGSTRTVTYTADDHNGFQAEVSTTGGNQQHYQLDDLNLHHFHH